MTSRALTRMGIQHNIVVEPQEVELYQEAVKKMNLLTTVIPLDMEYKKTYNLCDSLGLTKSTGSGPARNFIWEHSKAEGFSHHWIMDDNIRNFRRLHNNEKIIILSGAGFKAMEDFCNRYENIAMAGPNYHFFAPARTKHKPFSLNTRIYSCNFIRNDLPFRWRGRYNEDTILSLDLLKAGYCTVLFYAFLQEKMVTQALKGGNTQELYEGDTIKKGEKYAKTGTVAKSQMLVDVHPDVARISWRFDRWHHHVDYRRFASNKLIRKQNVDIPTGVNNYGMVLKVNNHTPPRRPDENPPKET